MEYIQVEGHLGLVRDPKTNSVINTNTTEYQEYIRRLNLRQQENQRIQTVEQDLANLKNDINEIKNLLRRLSNES